jgi:hypothetical protein
MCRHFNRALGPNQFSELVNRVRPRLTCVLRRAAWTS